MVDMGGGVMGGEHSGRESMCIGRVNSIFTPGDSGGEGGRWWDGDGWWWVVMG